MILKVEPCPKPRMTQRDKWLDPPRPVVAKYWLFADAIRIEAKKFGFELADAFDVIFYLPMPESWSEKKKRRMAGKPHRQRPDRDNLLKGFCDSLCPDDDSHIYDGRVGKYWTEGEGYIVVNNWDKNGFTED